LKLACWDVNLHLSSNKFSGMKPEAQPFNQRLALVLLYVPILVFMLQTPLPHFNPNTLCSSTSIEQVVLPMLPVLGQHARHIAESVRLIPLTGIPELEFACEVTGSQHTVKTYRWLYSHFPTNTHERYLLNRILRV